MTWDLLTARIRNGITSTDTSKDPELQLAMSQALALAETYCSRQFLYATNQIRWYYVNAHTFQVSRYPIETVNITGVTDYKVHNDGGWIKTKTPIHKDELTVLYTGGYKPDQIPADLELALWTVFDSCYDLMQGASVSAGGIKSASITGVGSVHFTESGSASNTGGAMGGLLPPVAASILDLYTREYA